MLEIAAVSIAAPRLWADPCAEGRADPEAAPARPSHQGAAGSWVGRFEEQIEYYVPTKPDRAIQSGFLDVAGGIEQLRAHLTFLGGVTLTGARGYIVQLGDHLRTLRYDTAALGAGPMFTARWAPLRVGVISFSLDAIAAVVVYDQHFPPGGDIYNFTFRLGGATAVRLTHHLSMGAGARWMHVSNGQGLGPYNPSYEGIGVHLDVLLHL